MRVEGGPQPLPEQPMLSSREALVGASPGLPWGGGWPGPMSDVIR